MSEDIKGQIYRTLVALFLFFVLMTVVGIFFGPALESRVEAVLSWLGLPGILIFTFLNDCFISPIPPDVVLFIISRSGLGERWLVPVLLVGSVSSASGLVGWWLGGLLRNTRIPGLLFGAKLEEGERLMKRYGALAVALGALTPVPFSLTTWTAGMLKSPARMVAMVSLLRIPRFLLYYLILTGALNLGQLLGSLTSFPTE
jgi:membrane protein YqaA with SNARE-associated domain